MSGSLCNLMSWMEARDVCDCIDTMNNVLAEKNGRLVQGFSYVRGEGRLELLPVFIETEKIDSKKKKPPAVVANFCPFCGE